MSRSIARATSRGNKFILAFFILGFLATAIAHGQATRYVQHRRGASLGREVSRCLRY